MSTDARMDMKVAGSGRIPAGEYNTGSVSGSGKLFGQVRCATFSSAGSCQGEARFCEGNAKISGSAKFSESMRAACFSAAGSFSVGGDITIREKLSCAGSVTCGGRVACHELAVAGLLKVGGDVESETVKVKGTLVCGGLLNAENIDLCFDGGTELDSVGGSRVAIYPRGEGNRGGRFSLRALFKKRNNPRATVNSLVEGDEITLSGVIAPRVTGRAVVIGDGCEIELVQYSESVEVSPDASVQRMEKI